jgi:hypothetical protein
VGSAGLEALEGGLMTPTNRIRTKADVQRSHHNGTRGLPMLNVKNYGWIGHDTIRRWRDAGHEFSGDSEFWDWLEQRLADDEMFNSWWDVALEDGWDLIREELDGWRETLPDYPRPFPGYNVAKRHARPGYGEIQVWSAGRSGGWLVIEGLPDVDTWDAIMLSRWRRFAMIVDDVNADTEYRTVWSIYANVWEPIAAERRRAEADDAAAALPVLVTC